MTTHISVVKGDRENNMSVLRRFRQRVMEWGGLRKMRSIRYHSRSLSPFVMKKNRLRAIARKDEREKLYKLGLVDRI